jgi:hypothetical protein
MMIKLFNCKFLKEDFIGINLSINMLLNRENFAYIEKELQRFQKFVNQEK